MDIENKLKSYHYTAIISLLFALIGFSYNAWRLEVSESNDNIRTASFQLLLELGNLEQIIYAAHYDKDNVQGNLRNGWVKVRLIKDLSMLTTKPINLSSIELHQNWSNNWQSIVDDRTTSEAIIKTIVKVRGDIQTALETLP